MSTIVAILYLISSILFIFGLKMLTRVQTARRGNWLSSSAMFLAILATLIDMGIVDYTYIIAGILLGGVVGVIMALRVPMTAMPEMVAIFNGFGGGASALVAISVLLREGMQREVSLVENLGTDTTVTLFLSILIGTVTFTGSLVAFSKLKGLISGQPILFPGNQILNLLLILGAIGLIVFLMTGATEATPILYASVGVIAISLLLGILLVTPIGGADMPVVISLLNSYSGLAAAAAGFVLANNVLIISGALVGASGLILTKIMCKAMNRSLANVLFGGFGQESAETGGGKGGDAYHSVKSCSPEEAAMIFDAAEKIIVVPGYGLAVAQAQYAVREVAEFLESKDKQVLYAIHPVAGRMPGHMNVLLAEANISYEQLKDLDEINPEFEDCDVALVLGANDVVNPAARHDTSSPIYGMPILDVDKSRTVIINKRTMNTGFAGIQNELFGFDNSIMVFGDAKEMLQQLLKDLKDL